MKKLKKNLPLVILKKLEPFVGKDTDLYFVDLKNSEFLMQAYDKDSDSDFYFFIKEYRRENQGSGIIILFEQKPSSNLDTEKKSGWIDSGNIDKYFNNWVHLLKEYNNTASFYDDPILKAYEKEYFTEFTEFVENTEDYEKPFTIKQQLALDTLFKNLKIELTNQSKDKPDEVVKAIELIKEEITDLQESVHDKTKAKVITTLSKIYAKISKLGISFIKAFGNEVQKQIIKSIIDGTVDYTKFLN